MSEQEKKSGGSTIKGSVMMVEKTPGGRLKQPYRPNELQDNTDFHQKRPRAPIVPSVAEEMKYFTEDCTSNENEFKKRKEYEEVPYDKEKQSFAKKITSNTERRDHSPESIMLQSTELDRKKGPIAPLVQPIPDVQSTASGLIDMEKEAATKVDEDSITEEVEELQPSEVAKKHSEWKAKPSSIQKKKEISWNNYENIILKDVEKKKSDVCILGCKASIGPCLQNIAPFKGPSGITICLPKKSLKCVNQPSGINVNISRKGLGKSKSTANEMCPIEREQTTLNMEKQSEMVNNNVPLTNFFNNVKDKISNVQSKIRNFFHS
ncbi:uncharacterized protein LOC126773941 [Nymphalis io]|uniref:uncharacterized protein LOC126773941 n=1 Tax=Inachis io TaxID=171585 RepID=UPI002169F0ED|nr:uncharacterized protein LOC126773941 [Nymphalis io]